MPLQPPSFKEAFLFWLKLGFISFGGPAGQIAIMHNYLVEKKKWISESRFLHALNYCMILPGPEAQQMATYSGWLLHGMKGALMAGILFVLPSVFILLGLSILYVTFGNFPAVAAMFAGLKPAVIAIILLALIKIGSRSLNSILHITVAFLSFIAIFFLNIPFPYIILSAVLVGAIFMKFFPQFFHSKISEKKKTMEEDLFFINSKTVLPHTRFSWKKMSKQIVVAVLLWGLPFLLIQLFMQDRSFWNGLSLFFTKSALVTFGGAYSVLPYVAQISVEKFHWLSSSQMIDGLALGETTPGPLIMVLAFVGFMGGYNHGGFSILFGTLGLLTTVWFTFLPCFLFILLGAPLVEQTQQNGKIKGLMSIISAAVVGVIVNLTVYLSKAVIFPAGMNIHQINWFNIAWVILSFIMMYRFKINMILWILVSALAGLGYYLVFP